MNIYYINVSKQHQIKLYIFFLNYNYILLENILQELLQSRYFEYVTIFTKERVILHKNKAKHVITTVN